jgi:hypothetical protein
LLDPEAEDDLLMEDNDDEQDGEEEGDDNDDEEDEEMDVDEDEAENEKLNGSLFLAKQNKKNEDEESKSLCKIF